MILSFYSKLNKDGCPVDSEEWLSLLHFQKSLIAHVLIQPSELKAQVSELLPPGKMTISALSV